MTNRKLSCNDENNSLRASAASGSIPTSRPNCCRPVVDYHAQMRSEQNINAHVVAIVTASTLIQCTALLGILPIAANSPGRHLFSTVEMVLVLLLLVQGWRIRQWAIEFSQPALVRKIARLCFYSLVLCCLGDLINRNYFEQYYQFDTVIKHSYLIQAIWFFFPAYSLIAIANWHASRQKVSARFAAISVLISLALGSLAFLSRYNPAVSRYISSAIFVYTLMQAVMLVSTLWLIKTHGWTASAVVVIGIWLASVADLLIGNFWIHQDLFPVIEHVNWIIYFTSLAMIQQMPFLVARAAHPR